MSHLQDLGALASTLGVAVYLFGQCKRSASAPVSLCQALLFLGLSLLVANAWSEARHHRDLVGTWLHVRPLSTAAAGVAIVAAIAVALRASPSISRDGRSQTPSR